jgi:outer membrane protein assembly factor BamB
MRLALVSVSLLLLAGCGSTSHPVAPVDAGGPIAPRRALRALAGPLGPQSGHVRWERKLEGPVVPGPIVSGTAVYAASNAGVLHAIRLATGTDEWRFDAHGSYGSDLSTSPIVLADGTVVWPGPHNTVYGLSARGTLLWREVLGGQPLTPALAPDGGLVLADQAGGVEELVLRGAAKPVRRWQVATGSSSYGSPAVAKDGTVYTTVDNALVAITQGHVRWRFAAKALSEVSPAVTADGTITFGANDSVQYGVAPSGRLVWRHRLGALTYSSAATTSDGLVYVGDHHGFVSALQARTGSLVARVLGLGPTATLHSVGVWTRPVIDAHHDVYFGTRPGHIYGFTSSGRKLLDLDTHATVDSYPVLAPDGTLLIGSENGTLYALR